jgi:hypothetical protein
VLWLIAVFMVSTAAVAALASANVAGLRSLWSILAVAFPALSTALSAYNTLYAFDATIKLNTRLNSNKSSTDTAACAEHFRSTSIRRSSIPTAHSASSSFCDRLPDEIHDAPRAPVIRVPRSISRNSVTFD